MAWRINALVSLLGWLVCLNGCLPVQPPLGPEHQKALQLIDQGTRQLRQEELQKAQASYQLAYDLAKLPQGLDGLGCVALARGEYGLAEGYFKSALARDPYYETANANLALLYDLTGREREAQQYYRKILAAQPLNSRARGNFGAFLADTVGGHEFEGQQELLRAQALENSPLIEENLRRINRRRAARM